MNKRGHKRGTIFEFNLGKIKKCYKSKNLCKSKLLNINGLRMKKIKKGFIIPPSGVLKTLCNYGYQRVFCFKGEQKGGYDFDYSFNPFAEC